MEYVVNVVMEYVVKTLCDVKSPLRNLAQASDFNTTGIRQTSKQKKQVFPYT